MKNIIKKLDNLTLAMDTEIDKRDEIFKNKSEKWQESEKGKSFKKKTYLLEEIYAEAIDWTMKLTEE